VDLGYDTAHLSDPTVAVIGGTGRTGRRVVDRLRARRVIVRIGSRAGSPPFRWEQPETAARVVAVEDRRAVLPGEPAVAPAHHHHEHLDQVGALLGEVVLEPGAGVVRTALEDALLDRIVEPLGEYLAGDAEVGLDLVEAVHPGPTRRARSVATTAHR